MELIEPTFSCSFIVISELKIGSAASLRRPHRPSQEPESIAPASNVKHKNRRMASFVRSCNGFPSGRTDTEPVQARREFPPMQKYGFRTDRQADGLRFVLPELPIFDEPDGDHSDLASSSS